MYCITDEKGISEVFFDPGGPYTTSLFDESTDLIKGF